MAIDNPIIAILLLFVVIFAFFFLIIYGILNLMERMKIQGSRQSETVPDVSRAADVSPQQPLLLNASKFCLKCGTQIPRIAEYCPECGTEQVRI
jgi:hypothetical protein